MKFTPAELRTLAAALHVAECDLANRNMQRPDPNRAVIIADMRVLMARFQVEVKP